MSAFTPGSAAVPSPTPMPTSTVNLDPLAAAVLNSATGSTSTSLVTSTLALSSEKNNQDPDGNMYGDLFSNEMYDSLFSDVFTTSFQKNPAVPGQHFQADPTAMLTDRLESIVVDQAMVEAFFTNPAQLAIYTTPSPSVPLYADPSTTPESEVHEVLPQQAAQSLTPTKDWPTLPEMYEFSMCIFSLLLLRVVIEEPSSRNVLQYIHVSHARHPSTDILV